MSWKTTTFVAASPLARACRKPPSSSCYRRAHRIVAAAKGSSAGSSALIPRKELLKRAAATDVPKEVVERACDLADRALREWSITATDFLRAPERMALLEMMGSLTELKCRADGGFQQAERQRLFFARRETNELEDVLHQAVYDPETGNLVDAKDAPPATPPAVLRESLALVELRGNFLFDRATHRDFLGAILGAGIVRQRIGDIIVLGDNGAQVVTTPSAVRIIQDGVSSVRTVPVAVRQVDWDDLQVREPIKKSVKSVEASTRVDAVASAGFGMSRSKMASMVKAGDVLVNWKEVKSSSKELKVNDMVTVRGKGRLEILEIATTAKGRFRVNAVRYM